MSDEYLDKSDVNTRDECWEMLRDSYDDTEGMISDADPEL